MSGKTTNKSTKKYQNGALTPQEETLLSIWKDLSEEKTYTAALDEPAKAALATEMFDAIRKKTEEKRKIWFWPAAAVALLALAASFAILHAQKPLSLQTAFGEIKTIVLPDSSEVVLNGNSTITYGKKEHELWLEGEAFFHVSKKTKGQRFSVHLADTLSIEVIGTEFNVQKRKQGTQIALISGKIKLYHQRNGLREVIDMEPNDVVQIGSQIAGGIQKTTEKSLEEHMAWQRRKIILADTPLSEIIQSLTETYGIHVTATDEEILRRRATGSLPIDPNRPDQLLKNIAELYSLTISIHNQQNNIMKTQPPSFVLRPR